MVAYSESWEYNYLITTIYSVALNRIISIDW